MLKCLTESSSGICGKTNSNTTCVSFFWKQAITVSSTDVQQDVSLRWMTSVASEGDGNDWADNGNRECSNDGWRQLGRAGGGQAKNGLGGENRA